MDDLLTYKEAANKLKVSERTIWGLVKSGQIKKIVIGKCMVRITTRALEEYIEKAQVLIEA